MVANIKQKGTLAISRPRQACVKFSPRKAALLLLNFFQTFQVHIQSLMPKKLIKLPIAASFLLAYSLLSGGLIITKECINALYYNHALCSTLTLWEAFTDM